MTRAPSFCGVILAAGESARMGRDKALLPWPPPAPGEPPRGRPHTFLSADIELLESCTDLVIVVAGKNAPGLTPVIYASSAFLVINPAPQRGQFSSLQIGLQEVLNRGRDAAILTLVDRPPVRPATVDQLRSAFIDAVTRGKWAVVPEHGGKHGHPIVVGREIIDVFLKAPDTATARDLEHQHQQHIEYVPVDDPWVAANVNTPEDYARLASQPR